MAIEDIRPNRDPKKMPYGVIYIFNSAEDVRLKASGPLSFPSKLAQKAQTKFTILPPRGKSFRPRAALKKKRHARPCAGHPRLS
jgi:hypothetical protein